MNVQPIDLSANIDLPTTFVVYNCSTLLDETGAFFALISGYTSADLSAGIWQTPAFYFVNNITNSGDITVNLTDWYAYNSDTGLFQTNNAYKPTFKVTYLGKSVFNYTKMKLDIVPYIDGATISTSDYLLMSGFEFKTSSLGNITGQMVKVIRFNKNVDINMFNGTFSKNLEITRSDELQLPQQYNAQDYFQSIATTFFQLYNTTLQYKELYLAVGFITMTANYDERNQSTRILNKNHLAIKLNHRTLVNGNYNLFKQSRTAAKTFSNIFYRDRGDYRPYNYVNLAYAPYDASFSKPLCAFPNYPALIDVSVNGAHTDVASETINDQLAYTFNQYDSLMARDVSDGLTVFSIDIVKGGEYIISGARSSNVANYLAFDTNNSGINVIKAVDTTYDMSVNPTANLTVYTPVLRYYPADMPYNNSVYINANANKAYYYDNRVYYDTYFNYPLYATVRNKDGSNNLTDCEMVVYDDFANERWRTAVIPANYGWGDVIYDKSGHRMYTTHISDTSANALIFSFVNTLLLPPVKNLSTSATITQNDTNVYKTYTISWTATYTNYDTDKQFTYDIVGYDADGDIIYSAQDAIISTNQWSFTINLAYGDLDHIEFQQKLRDLTTNVVYRSNPQTTSYIGVDYLPVNLQFVYNTIPSIRGYDLAWEFFNPDRVGQIYRVELFRYRATSPNLVIMDVDERFSKLADITACGKNAYRDIIPTYFTYSYFYYAVRSVYIEGGREKYSPFSEIINTGLFCVDTPCKRRHLGFKSLAYGFNNTTKTQTMKMVDALRENRNTR